jgi:GAF domain-containing protein
VTKTGKTELEPRLAGGDLECPLFPYCGRPEMSRETEVVQALVAMSDTLVADFDVIDVLTALTDRCVTLLGVSAAGVMLASPHGDLRLVASSSEAMRLLELFELQAEEGPCLDAFRTGEPVAYEEVVAGSGRWPVFAGAAAQAGFRGVFALPLRLRETTIGALNLFTTDTTPADQSNLIVARAFADLAAVSVLQHRAATDAQRLNEQLSHALTSRIVIEQAKGVTAERAGLDMAQAFSRLRGHARNNNLRLTDVAAAVVDGTLDPSEWSPPRPR